MADYRAISHEYAQGGIRAAVLLNSGAAVAVLTQLTTLPTDVRGAILASMIMWIAGATIGAATWIAAFGSTRYVDKWQDEGKDAHRVTSNRFQTAGYTMLAISLVLFAAGSITLAVCFHGTAAPN